MSPQNGANPQTPNYGGSSPNTNSYNNYNAYNNRTAMNEFGSPSTTINNNKTINTGVASQPTNFASYAPKDSNSSLSKDPAYSYNLGELLAAPTPAPAMPQYSAPVATTPKEVDPYSRLTAAQKAYVDNPNTTYLEKDGRLNQINRFLSDPDYNPWQEDFNSMY